MKWLYAFFTTAVVSVIMFSSTASSDEVVDIKTNAPSTDILITETHTPKIATIPEKPAATIQEPIAEQQVDNKGPNPVLPSKENPNHSQPIDPLPEVIEEQHNREGAIYRCVDPNGYEMVFGPGMNGFDPEANNCSIINQ